ncbi:hypothetical protein M0813_23625 [Anaeramoeba flamelloides]|uniref:PAS domain-containing protein n=1 Tax=Anaeramoeba flamelloides TaxID=1746091 RepID=A0ABQ8Y898_9EUKA|nr:hypothetical protein M0813_23625 [Anaeramoeba flamelloides]
MGNTANSTTHKIKKRHKKRYFKKLESTHLPISVMDLKGNFLFVNKEALKFHEYDPNKKAKKSKTVLETSQPYQNYFKCPTEKAIKICAKNFLESEDATYQFGWDHVTSSGKKFSVWNTFTLIKIGNQVLAQCINQPLDDLGSNEEMVQPHTIDESIIKVHFSDNSSVTNSNNMSNSSEIVKNSKEKSSLNNNENFNVIIEDFAEEIIDEIKKKIRNSKDFEKEQAVTEKLNQLNSEIGKKTINYEKTLKEILEKVQRQRQNQKKKYKDLEELYGKELNRITKEKKKNENLKKEIKELRGKY